MVRALKCAPAKGIYFTLYTYQGMCVGQWSFICVSNVYQWWFFWGFFFATANLLNFTDTVLQSYFLTINDAFS